MRLVPDVVLHAEALLRVRPRARARRLRCSRPQLARDCREGELHVGAGLGAGLHKGHAVLAREALAVLAADLTVGATVCFVTWNKMMN